MSASSETMTDAPAALIFTDAAARKVGVEYLLEHKMTGLYREEQAAGRVIGVAVDNNGSKLNIRARNSNRIHFSPQSFPWRRLFQQ